MIRDTLRAWLRQELGISDGPVPAYDRLAFYAATVEQVDASKRWVEVRFDATHLAAARVPMRSGVAGASALVTRGARCLVGWAGGDERAPYVAAWESTTPQALALVADALYLGTDGQAQTEPAVKGEQLRSWLIGALTAYNAHSHAGNGLQTAQQMPALPGGLLSAKVRIG